MDKNHSIKHSINQPHTSIKNDDQSSENKNTNLNEGMKIDDKWEDIGYHRVLGGFFYNIIFAIIAAGYVLILPLFIPYSESYGFYQILTGIFNTIFVIGDFGLASALSRFIAEYRVKDPKKTLEYIRFFIWFQAFTGLIQTTAISLIGLYGLKGTNLSFMPWMFVWLSTVQYPGWLGVYNEALKGFQQYGKVALAGLLNTIIFQLITLLIGAQLGAYLGRLNPSIGGIMGASIGLVIGYYVDDFSSLLITAKMFSKVIEPMGFSIKDTLIPQFDREVMISSLKFGLGVMLFVLSYTSVGSILALVYTESLPNYSTFVGVLGILSPIIGLTEQINTMHIGNHRSTVSEAFFNGKESYAVYLLSNGFRTIGMISMFITSLVLILGPKVVSLLFPQYLNIFNQIFIWKLILSLIFQHSHLMNEVLIGTGNHKFNISITIIEQITALITTLICINLELGIFVLIIPTYFQTAVKQGIGWIYINKKIINLRINPWQNWIATLFAGVIFGGSIQILYSLANFAIIPFIPELIILIIFVVLGIYILPGLLYFLPLALFGGFDNHTLTDFKKAVDLAGPSKMIVNLWYKGAKKGADISNLHGKFPMEYENVGREIKELMIMKSKIQTN